MAFQQRQRPYETMIRHHADGTIGAHHVTIQELYDDVSGTILYAQVQPPQPVQGAGLAAVLGQATEAALVEIEVLKARIAELETQVAALEA